MWVIVTCQCRFIKCKVWWTSSISGGCACVGTRVQISVTSGHFCWEPKTAIKCSLLIFFFEERSILMCFIREKELEIFLLFCRCYCCFVAIRIFKILFLCCMWKEKKREQETGIFIEQPHQNFRMLMIKKSLYL